MVLYSSANFRILKTWAILSYLIRFDLGFWQASKPFYRKLRYKEKVFEEFRRLPPLPRKIVSYSSTKFGILKPLTIISNLIILDLGFWQASKQIYRKLEYSEKILDEFQRLLGFPRKMVLYSSTNFCILKPWAIISHLIRFNLGFSQPSIPFYRKLEYRQKVLEKFQRLPCFPKKWYFFLPPIFAF